MALSDVNEAFSPRALRRHCGILKQISRTSRFYWLRLLLENRTVFASILFILGVSLMGLFAPFLTAHDPEIVDPMNRLSSLSDQNWLGTDALGRDVLARLIYGARISLIIGVAVTAVAATVGTILGLTAAYYRRIDNLIMRIMDGLMAFPGILLAIAIMASLGPRSINVVIALAVVNTPRIARLVRGTALVINEELYVEGARAIGLTDSTIIRRYILRNSLSPLIVQSTFVMAAAIISEASLSFLGAGVPPDVPTWGSMLRDGQRLIATGSWLMAVFPGTALFLTVLAFNLIGDGLRDALDPRQHGR